MKLWERFPGGRATEFPRLTHDGTLREFPPRSGGLRVLLVNAPIRSWSFPNIAPLGQEYVGAVAMMDGHDVRVLDLNAERRHPVESDARLQRWADRRLEQAIDAHDPDVIGFGGIITQYATIRRLIRVARSARPQAKIMLGGGIASCLPAFMATRLPVDAVIQEEGEVTVSEVLARWEAGADLEGVLGVAHQLPGGQMCDHGHRPSVKAGADGLDHLPWPLRSLWPEDQVYKRNPVGHLNWQSKWTGGAPTEKTPFSTSLIASRGCPYASKACDYAVAAETPILRDDFSWIPAHMLRTGDKILSVSEFPLSDGPGSPRQWEIASVDGVYERSVEGFEIQTTRGCVVGSSEHPWLTKRHRRSPSHRTIQWVETEKLRLGNRIAIVANPNETIDCGNPDYKRGYIRGLFEGDGGRNRRNGIWQVAVLAMTDFEALDRFQEYCNHFGIESRRKLKPPQKPLGRKPFGKVSISKQSNLNMLDAILQKPIDCRESAAGYLAGIYDAEGSLSEHRVGGAMVTISQRAGPVLDRTIEASKMLDIPFVLEGPTVSGVMRLWLRSRPSTIQMLRFFSLTRPAISRKRQISGRVLRPIWATITAIRSLGMIKMIDLKTTSHTFVANGIVSHNCYASYLGTQYRLRSPAEVVDEMQWLVRRYDVAYLHFLDDLGLTDYRWALAFANEILKRKFIIQWGMTCRTNIVADDVLRARREGRQNFLERCHEAGMRQAGYGVESASPTILKNIDKSGQTVEKMEIAIAETKRVMGYADCSFMVASPGETEATVRETVDFCKRVGLQPEVFFFTTAYPGTTFWQLALDRGLIRKAVTGERGPADGDMIEQYFVRLGEQGEQVRTNFSDLPDEEIEALARWAVAELNPSGSRIREPHSGDAKGLVGATRADL